MKCIILAAGYATRLYPLTKNYPKPLLEVKNKKIIEWLIDNLDDTKEIDKYVIVSNHAFYNHFKKWAENTKREDIVVLDDGTTSNETRLGAVKDIEFAIEKLNIDEDVMVLAGDNLIDFSLKGFIDYFKEVKSSCIMRYFEKDFDKIRKSGNVEIDNRDKVKLMLEKPLDPKSHWCVPPFYIYAKKDLSLIKEALEDDCPIDAPGSLITWMYNKTNIYAFKMPGKRYDIGNLDSYNLANKLYMGINKN